MCRSMMLGAAASAILTVTSTASPAADVTFDLKYGVLAGLTGDPAADGQAWNEAARLGIDQIAKSLQRLGLSTIKVELADSQDSQGSPQPGVEGAQKLVKVDHVQVIIGDFYSSVTSAVATAGHYSQQRPHLHRRHQSGAEQAQRRQAGGARLGAGRRRRYPGQGPRPRHRRRTLGKNAKVNVAARNDGYGAALSAIFKEAWLPGAAPSRNSSSTITSSRPSTPRRNRSPTATRTAGCSSISARPSRSSRSR